MIALSVNNVTKIFDRSKILDGVSLEVEKHHLVALLGESGSGKSTLLRIIAGFETINAGSITVNGKVMVDNSTFIKPEDRKVGVIFQNYALFPHLSVRKNIAFGMKKCKETEQRLNQLIALFELTDQQHKKPARLSGGQQQRVAIARALAVNPYLLLLDEPFSNLDQTLRRKVRTEIRRIHEQFETPMILVTHDPDDALEMADKIAVLQNGKIVQYDTPDKLYNNPINEYVANLFGPCSVFNDQLIRPEQVDFSKKDFRGKVTHTVYSAKGNAITIELENQTIIAYLNNNRKVKIDEYIEFGLK